MQHLVRTPAPLTDQEQRILELSNLFNERTLTALFKSVFMWYFVPHETVRTRILEEANAAMLAYQAQGMIPEFFNRIPSLYAKIRALEDAPVGGRHNPVRTESDMKHALIRACSETTAHVCAPYDRRHCPCFWNAVFYAYFGEMPVSAKDSRYDTLFGVGMPAYTKLFG